MTIEKRIEQAEKEVEFTENDVTEWCAVNGDPNPIHTDEEAAKDSTFGQRVVPGMMLLDQISGMLTNLGTEDQEIILAGVTAARFREPVFLDEMVTITFSNYEDEQNYTAIDFDIRVNERDCLAASGSVSIVIN